MRQPKTQKQRLARLETAKPPAPAPTADLDLLPPARRREFRELMHLWKIKYGGDARKLSLGEIVRLRIFTSIVQGKTPPLPTAWLFTDEIGEALGVPDSQIDLVRYDCDPIQSIPIIKLPHCTLASEVVWPLDSVSEMRERLQHRGYQFNADGVAIGAIHENLKLRN